MADALMAFEKVRKYRALRGQTQEWCAEEWGCSTRSWQRYESVGANVPEPLLKHIRKWAKRAVPKLAHYLD
jgi:hypothetical protein